MSCKKTVRLTKKKGGFNQIAVSYQQVINQQWFGIKDELNL